jgi:hypothetical protein
MATVAKPKMASEMGAFARSVTISRLDHGGAAEVHPASRLLHSSLLSAARTGETLQRHASDLLDAGTRTITGRFLVRIFCAA